MKQPSRPPTRRAPRFHSPHVVWSAPCRSCRRSGAPRTAMTHCKAAAEPLSSRRQLLLRVAPSPSARSRPIDSSGSPAGGPPNAHRLLLLLLLLLLLQQHSGGGGGLPMQISGSEDRRLSSTGSAALRSSARNCATVQTPTPVVSRARSRPRRRARDLRTENAPSLSLSFCSKFSFCLSQTWLGK